MKLKVVNETQTEPNILLPTWDTFRLIAFSWFNLLRSLPQCFSWPRLLDDRYGTRKEFTFSLKGPCPLALFFSISSEAWLYSYCIWRLFGAHILVNAFLPVDTQRHNRSACHTCKCLIQLIHRGRNWLFIMLMNLHKILLRANRFNCKRWRNRPVS